MKMREFKLVIKKDGHFKMMQRLLETFQKQY